MTPPLQRLRRSGPDPAPCKVCGGPAAVIGEVDFNRSCEERRGVVLPPSGVAIPYRRCATCGLMFTDAFDDWSPADFEAAIYNAGYAEVDPDYESDRPAFNARLVARLFAADAGRLSLLDYGGGNGRFAAAIRAAGFARAETYDPFHPDHRERPEGRFDLVTCFETLEHMPDPVAGAADIASFLAEGEAVAILGTLTQPADIETQGVGWWYVGPRNGHVTLFSREAVARLWGRLGLRAGFAGAGYHAAYRRLPDFARHLLAS